MDGCGHDPGWWREQDIDAFEPLSYLLRSEHRIAVLEALQQSTQDRTELQATTGVTRPTLARILSAFESRGWIEREASGAYSTTTLGAALAEAVLNAIDTVHIYGRIETVIDVIPGTYLPADPSVFAGADLTVAKPGAPAAPTRRLAALVEQSGTYRECTPIALSQQSQTLLAEHLNNGDKASVVYQPAVIEALAVDPNPAVLRALETGQLCVHVHESVPFRLTLLDERAAIARYDESTGAVTALVILARPAALEWAHGIFTSLRSASRPLAETEVELASRAGGRTVVRTDGEG